MASWGSCAFHELRDLNERIKAAASESEMDAFYTGLLDEMMNGGCDEVFEALRLADQTAKLLKQQ